MKPADHFTLRVQLFGPASRLAGAADVWVEVAPGATAGDVLQALAQQHPSIASTLSGARLAVNATLAAARSPVTDGDELALIAMVSGG